jgi:hypothetical protein
MTAEPADQTAGPADQAADAVGAAIDSERAVQELAGQWAAEPEDPSGLRERFRVVTAAGNLVPDLEQHRG